MTESLLPLDVDDADELYATELLNAALRVLNAGLESHQESLRGALLSSGLEHLSGLEIGIMVYKDEPNFPHDYFTLHILEGRVCLAQRGRNDPGVELRVPRSLLQEMVAEPEPYINNPVKVHLDWLRHRFHDVA